MNNDIELIPAVEKSSIKRRLEDALSKCDNVKGAVAYWTIDTDFIKNLASVLQREDSYYCIDIHKPTNIDYLANFKQSGANIFLHNYDLKSNSSNYELKKENKIPYLLHSKIILFEMPENNVEIWLGSHNFTQRAICGVNIESSFIIRSNKNSKIHKDVLDYLNFIKNSCIPFDINDVDFYKLLQGQHQEDTGSWVLQLIGENVANLVDEKTIQLLGIDNKDISDKLGKEIIIQALDLNNEQEYIYKAKIIQAGEINSQNPKSSGITFSARRYAVRGLDKIPYLRSEQEIEPSFLKNFNYYINLEITEILIDYEIYEKPRKNQQIWKEIVNAPHLNRMDKEDQKILFNQQENPVKRSEKSEIKLKRVSLKEIISILKRIKFYFSEETALLSIQEEMPKQIKRTKILRKRILKKVKNNFNKNNK
ncbi:hypothetical protein GTQ43_04570 [Nostoc sp. KVJ3]|uniref:hypothetical protein n=1 Tax=Nostoc sp. KVJ3 TaxID=457945 RepID=UPI0022380353|nr:hypothetical protein [Nostoc sp. KVJ3]MCW5313117.1 hypothetical protein [Nostoc sp. KVJ3]